MVFVLRFLVCLYFAYFAIIILGVGIFFALYLSLYSVFQSTMRFELKKAREFICLICMRLLVFDLFYYSLSLLIVMLLIVNVSIMLFLYHLICIMFYNMGLLYLIIDN